MFCCSSNQFLWKNNWFLLWFSKQLFFFHKIRDQLFYTLNRYLNEFMRNFETISQMNWLLKRPFLLMNAMKYFSYFWKFPKKDLSQYSSGVWIKWFFSETFSKCIQCLDNKFFFVQWMNEKEILFSILMKSLGKLFDSLQKNRFRKNKQNWNPIFN